MTALRQSGGLPGHVESWAPDASDEGDQSAARARALAHASLVQTSLKVANLRAAVQTRLLDARTEAEEILEAARAEAARIRLQAREDAELIHEQALIDARRNTIAITDRALDRRDVLVIGTVEKIANVSTMLLGMSDQLIANSVNPALAEQHLAQFMVALTEMVPEFGDIALAGYGSSGRDGDEKAWDGEERRAA